MIVALMIMNSEPYPQVFIQNKDSAQEAVKIVWPSGSIEMPRQHFEAILQQAGEGLAHAQQSRI